MSEGELPEGWSYRRLGDVLKLQNGYAFKRSEWSTTGLPIIRIQNLNNAFAPFNHFCGDLDTKYRAHPGDLLFAWSGTPGTSFGAHVWRGEPAWVNQHIFRVSFDDETYDRDFLRLALSFNLIDYVRSAQGGVGLAHITKAKLNESLLVTPPLKEQRLIAAQYEGHEQRHRSASNHIRRAAQAIERLQNVLLSTAYKACLEAPGGGGSVPLGDLLREPFKNGYSAKPVGHETPFRVLTLTATTSGWFNGSKFKYTEEQFAPHSQFWVAPGDILVQRGNTAEYVGVPAVYDGEPRSYLYPDLMIRVRPRPDISPRFAWYMMLAPESRNFLRSRASGSAGNMPKINQKVLAELPIPLPDATERDRVVRQLDSSFELLKAIKTRVAQATRLLDRADQAVLVKAFRGELVTATEECAPSQQETAA